MNNNRTFSRKLLAVLLAALLLIGVLPVYAEETKDPFKGTVSFTVNTRGFGTSAAALSLLNFSLGIDAEKKAADLGVGLLGKNVDLIFAWDNGTPRFTVPASGAEVYTLSKELIAQFAQAGKELITGTAEENEAAPEGGSLVEKAAELLQEFASSAAITDEEGTYTYSLLSSGTQSGRVFTLTLSKEQWNAFWNKLITALLGNTKILNLIASQADVPADQVVSMAPEIADEVTGVTGDWSLVVFYQDGDVRAVNLGGAALGFVYESTGSAQAGGRTDTLALRQGTELMKLFNSSFAKTPTGFTGSVVVADTLIVSYSLVKDGKNGGTVNLDFAVGEQGINIVASYTEGDVNIAVPGAVTNTIVDVNALGETLGKVLENAFSSLFSF